MVKKTKSSTGSSKSAGGDLAASVKESAQQIWLAGMGAFAKAQEEGTKVFAELVKEGKNLQAKTQGMAEDKIGEVTGRMTAMADTMQSKAGQNWDKLEGLFEQRTAKAMGKLGVPTAKELAALVKRVDKLEVDMARHHAKPSAAPRSAPAKAARKSPAKTAAKSASKTRAKAATARTRKTGGKSATAAS